MSIMLSETGITFKDFEEKTYKFICKIGQEYTKDFLEEYDNHLAETRDKSAYRDKGKRKTTVKTIYGEVEYYRRVYQVKRDDGITDYVYLLDEQLEIAGVGHISMNMAEKMVSSITEMSYRQTAEKITSNTGQCISAMGVWNVIQALGEKVCEEEAELVKAHKAGKICGEKETPILFEETDGVYVRLQNESNRKGEIKVGIAYDGWKEVAKNRYVLDNKVAVAGFSSSKDFQEYREATIAQTYNTDEINMRIMNADGAEWIKNLSEAETIFQLDPFHKNKAIKENIPYPEIVKELHHLLNKKDIDGLFDYLETYKNSLVDDDEIEKADRLITYFKNNREGLIPYNERNLLLPESKEGLEYKNLGTMENHIWSIIAKRMKHNHTSWSIKGGNNLAKILAKKCSGKLDEVASKLKMPTFDAVVVDRIESEILSAGSIVKKIGKGYEYPVLGTLPKLGVSTGRVSRAMLNNFAGM